MLFAGMSSFTLCAQDLPGYYLTRDPFTKTQSIVYLYKTKAGSYAGKVFSVENDPKNKYLDYLFLWNLQFDSLKKEFVDGHIKYPGIPGTYRTYMRFEPDGRLRVRGYLGVSALGVTVFWKKLDATNLTY